MAIRPIDLPSAAGIDFSGGDVRHFSQGDAVNVPGLSNPTRNLAERDNLLAEKVNEVVSVVNNREQFVPLPIIRTNVPPNEEIVVTNYRIPAGFEARVLNAVVSTSPASLSAELDIYYSDSFGGSTGTAVVTVTPGSEFTGDVNFYQVGEFILTLKNTGAATLELAASVMLTMRPLGAEGTLLVGSVIEGPPGRPGMRGGPGPPGTPGTGGAGSPGMIWRGPWANGGGYVANDVVSYQYSGTYGSWICRTAHTATLGVNDPETDAVVTWNYVAYGVFQQGEEGDPGPPGGDSLFASNSSIGYFVTGNDYVSNPYNDEYTAGVASAPNQQYQLLFNETTITNSTATAGAAMLNGAYRTCFSGSVAIYLPTTAGGAATNYTTADIFLAVVNHGTMVSAGTAINSSVDAGTYVKTIEQVTETWGWRVQVISPDALPLSFLITGVQSIP